MKNSPENFLNDAEKMIREAAPSKGWTVWRGEYDGFIYPPDCTYDCVLAGLGDPKKPPEEKLLALAVAVRAGAVEIETKSSAQSTPFGGGWNPLQELQKVIERLPSCLA